ncbi:MAG: Calx-beta domain-containing protein [Cyanobacteriota bacterium]|nr:Calx-beta domain-containing protein [Cyanobacteriota bacterium]
MNNGDQLDTRSFTSNSSGVAIGNAGQIIYNTSTGELSYDGDGAGNSNPARFAILSGKESVSLQDFRLFNRTYSSPAFPVITLAVTPASVLENGPTNLLYTFTRTGSTASPLTVNYAISGSADGTDYTGVTPGFGKTITFPAGSATASVSVNPTADTGVEPNETIALSLAAGTGYTIGTTSPVVGTIANDDLPPPPVISPPVITLAVSPASVPEDGPNNLIYTFSRTGSTTSALTVNYTAAGTATLGIDYSGIAATPATITFAPGSSTATLTVDPPTDSSIEPNETVALTLTAGAGYIIGTPAAAIGTITNDDSAFAIAPLASNKGEGRSGPTPFTFTVSRLGSAAAAGSVRWTVAGSGSNPTNAADFTGATSGTLSFAAGQASRILTINALGDLRQERDETFAVRLSTPTGAILGPTVVAAATIRNDDQIGDQNPNTLRGGNLPDWVDGRGNGTTGDILTGGGAGDTFAFRFRESPLTAPDAITDFAFGVDKIDLFSPPGGALGAPRSLSRAARNSTATTLGALAAAVFADANGARPGNQVLTANGAALVQATNPAIAGTYLLINNATAGRSDLDDLLIKLGGSLPGLPPVGVVAVGTVFA